MSSSSEIEHSKTFSPFTASLNINLNGRIDEPVKKLIESVSKGIGISYLPRHIKKLAKASKAAAKEIGLTSEETKVLFGKSLMLAYGQQNRQQKNLESIIQKTVDALPNEVNNEPVEEDWIAHFFEKCKNISNEQMQLVWSKLLAGEIKQPGSFQKRTLEFVTTLETDEARIFSEYCRFVFEETSKGCSHFRIFFEPVSAYIKEKVPLSKYWGHLADIGLIHSNLWSSTVEHPLILNLGYFGHKAKMQFGAIGNLKLPLACSYERLTSIGEQLYKIAFPEPDHNYFNLVLDSAEKDRIVVTRQ